MDSETVKMIILLVLTVVFSVCVVIGEDSTRFLFGCGAAFSFVTLMEFICN